MPPRKKGPKRTNPVTKKRAPSEIKGKSIPKSTQETDYKAKAKEPPTQQGEQDALEVSTQPVIHFPSDAPRRSTRSTKKPNRYTPALPIESRKAAKKPLNDGKQPQKKPTRSKGSGSALTEANKRTERPSLLSSDRHIHKPARISRPSQVLHVPSDSDGADSPTSTSSASPTKSQTNEIWKSIGYELSSTSTMSTSGAITRETSVTNSKVSRNNEKQKKKTTSAIKAENSLFNEGLKKRRARMESVSCPPILSREKREVLSSLPRDLGEAEETAWRKDLEKCSHSAEALFQHIIMIEIIDRHHMGSSLDYNCDTKWTSPRPPSVTLYNKNDPNQQCVLVHPQPDLMVGFAPHIFIDPFEEDFIRELKPHMFPEVDATENYARAFPFFVFEAKGSRDNVNSDVAIRQCVNAATHALFNIWKFMKGIEESTFFKSIKFFSISGNGRTLCIRMHWAEKLTDGTKIVSEDVPLGFKYEQICRLSDGQFSKAKAVSYVQNILHYGEKTLLPILDRVVKETLKRLKAKEGHTEGRQSPARSNSSAPGSVQSLSDEVGDASQRSTELSTPRQRDSQKKRNPPAAQDSSPHRSKRRSKAGPSATMSFESTNSVNSNLRDLGLVAGSQ